MGLQISHAQRNIMSLPCTLLQKEKNPPTDHIITTLIFSTARGQGGVLVSRNKATNNCGETQIQYLGNFEITATQEL
jgi:hypothetical protein